MSDNIEWKETKKLGLHKIIEDLIFVLMEEQKRLVKMAEDYKDLFVQQQHEHELRKHNK